MKLAMMVSMDQESPRIRKVTIRQFTVSSGLSALAGVIFTWWFAVGRIPVSTSEIIVFGAIAGFFIGLPFTFVEQLFGQRIDRLSPKVRFVARVSVYLAAAVVGFGLAFPIAGLIVFRKAILLPSQFPFVGSGIAAMIIALAIYSYMVMKERLEASLVRIKEQEFAERELEIARSIQTRLLPPPEIEGDGYRVVARNIAATYVAGDYYDVFHLADGMLGLAVADVAGKGVGASLIMSTAKAMLPLLAVNRSVEETIQELNVRLRKDLAKREFVALAFIRYDPATGCARIANAGLPDPILVSEGKLDEIEVTGPRIPLGMMDGIAYEAVEVTLQPGDRLLVFTDGLPEAPTGHEEQLGYEALREMVASQAGPTTGEWIDGLLNRVVASTPDGPDDDCTVMVLERLR